MKYITGDVFEYLNEYQAFFHGCNCFSVMGAGVAALVKRYYPSVYEVDKNSLLTPEEKLGKYTYSKENNIYMVNLYCQYDTATRLNPTPFKYRMFEKSFTSFLTDFPHVKKIIMPRIGAGLAGGDWNIIETIINRISVEFNVDITVCIHPKDL